MASNNTQNINAFTYGDGDLKSLLDLYKKLIKLEFACHHVGTIQSFNPEEQTAAVTVNYTKTFQKIVDTGDIQVVTEDYPVIIGCPVIVLGGGEGALTFPIQPGDECLLIFNDRDIGNWFAGSSNSAPATQNLHSISDCICLVGLRSLPNALVDYDADAVVLRYGEYKLRIADEGIALVYGGTTITMTDESVEINVGGTMFVRFNADGTMGVYNNTSELITSLVELFTDIQNATTNTLLGPQPLVMPLFATNLSNLESFQE